MAETLGSKFIGVLLAMGTTCVSAGANISMTEFEEKYTYPLVKIM